MDPDEPLLHRDELTAFLFSIADIRDDVASIRRMLEEDDDGEASQADG